FRHEHHTQGPGVGLLRLQVDVATEYRIGLGGRRVCDQGDRPGRCTLRNADRRQVSIVQWRGAGAGIDTQVGQAYRQRREQLADVRRADRVAVIAADLDAIARFPAAAGLPGPGLVAARAVNLILRVTDAGFQRQAFEARLVLDDRSDKLAIAFVNRIAAVDVRGCATGAAQLTWRLRQD